MLAGALVAFLGCQGDGPGCAGADHGDPARPGAAPKALVVDAPVADSAVVDAPVADGDARQAQVEKRPAAPPPPSWLKPGYREFMRHDDAQLCVFSSFLEHDTSRDLPAAKRQKLAAGKPVVFGAYPGYCVREGCDDRPSIECSVERDGMQLTVHSRYWGARKPGSDCGDVDCHWVAAGCQSPPLERGTYTVRHGGTERTLRIPATLRKPCLDLTPRVPPGGPPTVGPSAP